ncbi:5'/3'-nucleotidase SurE [Natronolimnohabitans innermongolicus]|uniref:5'-nucleotidase SurE n=1 Tax=Natronolimnohabitans innermongolicus JCM 12255 TaxID=1227499 RepID=L9XIV8_9EURY|nr:5'/3'-nucleotidase SurE [Natronolimnohabitans innermongolicus]ELY61650.1 stationary-phase survival protein SurE [Natronolimnohabitans innermongolicus JCM 12255]
MSDPDDLEILLTNDDGIHSTGLRALYDALSAYGNVTVVAPATDQSACGRSISHEVDVEERDLGYAVYGTPADCVVAGLAELGPFPDIVVAGCNKGANLGEYVLGRSGTISAAVEAAFFDVPAIATSMYVPAGDTPLSQLDLSSEDYAEATRVTSFLVERALEAGVFDHAAYLNVNVPVADGEPAPVEVTRPSKRYEMDAERNGDSVHLRDRVWESMDPETLPDPNGTDRRAVVEGRISVSPLTAPHSTNHHDALSALAETYTETITSN